MTSRDRDDAEFDCQEAVLPSRIVMIPAMTSPPGQPAWRMFNHFVLSLSNRVATTGLMKASTVPLPRARMSPPQKIMALAIPGFDSAIIRPEMPITAQISLAGEREHHRKLVTDLVDDQAEQNDADGEWPDLNAFESTHLCGVEVEQILGDRLIIEEKHAGDEAECRGNQGDEATPEEPLGVGASGLVGHSAEGMSAEDMGSLYVFLFKTT